jgi:glyoxylase-like metal-dependent hydrolase (beta-lactamase superfamily II)
VFAQVERDAQLISELWLTIKYIVDTHVHADHITGSYNLQKLVWGQIWVWIKNNIMKHNQLFLSDSEILKIWELDIKILETPWHTSWCISLLLWDKLFCWDLLFVRWSGRTDFQWGNNKSMFHSVRNYIFNLSDNIHIYPGHDYNWFTSSTIWEEKKYNPRLNISHSYEQFKNIMNNLNLAYPKKIDISLPVNKNCWKID